MRILFLSVLACLALSTTSQGQSLKKVLEAGDESFENRDYYNAFRCYETVLKYAAEGAYKEDTLAVKFSYAQSSQRLQYFSKALHLYTELQEEANGKHEDIYARAVFNRAKMSQNLAPDNKDFYSQALDLYQFFINNQVYRKIDAPAEIQERYREEAMAGIESCTELRDAFPGREDTLYRLTNVINSGYSELAPVLIGNTLYYSSLKFLPPGARSPRQPMFLGKQMKAAFPLAGAENQDTITMVMRESEGFNADGQHTLHATFTRDESRMFFTQCIQEGEGFHCDIYSRLRSGDGWGIPQKLALNAADSKAFSTTQPSVSFDCTTGKEYLYFSSGRDGGKGGMDIWRCEIMEDGKLSEPENLEAANTEWDEATPFYHSRSGRLFFSSNAPPSYGEYDIFYVQNTPEGFTRPQNMGLPYNSGYNDEYYFLSPDGSQEFFASDRPRSMRFVEELEFCCTDIYTIGNDVDIKLQVSIDDCNLYNPAEAVVEIYDLSCGERNLLSSQERSGTAPLDFTVQRFGKYEVVARSDSYEQSLDSTIDLSSEIYKGADVVSLSFPMYPTELNLTVEAYDAASGQVIQNAVVRVRNSEDNTELQDKGNRSFQLSPNIQYYVAVQAPQNAEGRMKKYEPKEEPFSYSLSDKARLRKLCGDTLLRIPMAIDTPVIEEILLYFDHDMPTRYRGIRDQTRQSFQEAIELYMARKDEYLENNDPSDSLTVERFFSREVEGGLNSLQSLAGSLIEYVDYLGETDQVVIGIKGYCSPRGSEAYNRLLSKRRIQCIRSYLESYTDEEGRSLASFIGDKIIIQELPLGESLASSKFPDENPNSIWGIGPALDRRVEIENVSKGTNLTAPRDEPSSQTDIQNSGQ